jgi:hypothetical protein
MLVAMLGLRVLSIQHVGHAVFCHVVHSTKVEVMSCVVKSCRGFPRDSPRLDRDPRDVGPIVFVNDRYEVPIGSRIVTLPPF